MQKIGPKSPSGGGVVLLEFCTSEDFTDAETIPETQLPWLQYPEVRQSLMEEGGRRLGMKRSEAGQVSKLLLVDSGGLEVSRVKSLISRVRERADIERSKKRRSIVALLQRICDRDCLDFCPIL